MKKYYTFIVSAILLIACKTEITTEKPTVAKPQFVSASYLPHKFQEDDRSSQIESLAPKLEKLFQEHAEVRHIPGIAYGIVVGDELVLKGSTGTINLEKDLPVGTRSQFRIASMTKSFTAMAILKLRDEGKLSLEDPVQKFIPEVKMIEYPTSDSPLIDVENLLTMTAGFPEDNPWGDRQLDESDQMLVDLMQSGVSVANPISHTFEYSNTGYALLGKIISEVSNRPFQTYIKEEILQPLGMNQTYWEYENISEELLALGYRWEDEQWKREPMLHDGAYGAMGGLITSIEDFSKYVSFHLSAWPPRSESDTGPVKRSSLREMHTPQYSQLIAQAQDWNGASCPALSGYGFGLRILESCKGIRRVGHGGALPGFGSSYVFYPDLGIGLMAFGNRTYTSPWPYVEILKLVFDSLDITPRQLPTSEILNKRKAQVAQWIQQGDSSLEASLFAENFFLDFSRKVRLVEIGKVLEQTGTIQELGELSPENQLRGVFHMKGEKGSARVFFTLTPEKDPKVQQLDVSFSSGN